MKSPMHTLASRMATVSAVILALLPLHAFLTVGLSSVIGQYTALRLWKEFLLLGLLMAAVSIYIRDAMARRAVRREPIIWLICIYVLLLLLTGLVSYVMDRVSLEAFLFGLILDSRYLVFFAVTWLITRYSDQLVRLWKRLLLLPAAVVVGFAALQYSVLPADFLRHFGYGPDTIMPSATIDQKDAYTRIQSTLRGPNPLGAYLVLVLSSLGTLLAWRKKLDLRLILFFALAGMALVFTFSRSAWLGACLSLTYIVFTALSSVRLRKWLVLAAAVGLLVFSAVGYALRDNDHFQNVFFHTNEHSQSAESSNSGHIEAVRQGVSDVVRMPLGSGTGTAGPASVYNTGHGPARIAENYYVQIAQEVGILGLGLFITINALVVVRLWQAGKKNGSLLPRLLLASFFGITIINLLMHGWADDTLAYLWWGFAGAAISSFTKDKHETHP